VLPQQLAGGQNGVVVVFVEIVVVQVVVRSVRHDGAFFDDDVGLSGRVMTVVDDVKPRTLRFRITGFVSGNV
jgi:hypothetical protein